MAHGLQDMNGEILRRLDRREQRPAAAAHRFGAATPSAQAFPRNGFNYVG
jgi:hypothetical protein